MRFWIAVGLVVASVGCGRAQIVSPPVISLRVEQPAYTGMPIWLHVIARDQCFENTGMRPIEAKYLWLRWDGAEVTLDGHPVPRTPFSDVGKAPQFRLPNLLPCVVSPPQGPEHDHVFALNGAYVFDKPGHYAVRWVTKDRNYPDHAPENAFRAGRGDFYMQAGSVTSGWVGFDVAESTPAQRETWLAGILAAPPDDDDMRIYDTIPALLAAWRDPRVVRALLDMMCADTNGVSQASASALNYDLDKNGVDYFAGLAKNGCLGATFGMANFVRRHGHELAAARSGLLHGFASHLRKLHPSPDELIAAVGALSAIRNEVPASDNSKQDNVWADDEVVQASAKYFVHYDYGGTNYTQRLQNSVVGYFNHQEISPGAHDLLRRIAVEGVDPLWAFEAVEHLHDPTDLMFLADRLIDMRDMLAGNYLTDLDDIVKTFGTRAAPMLLAVAKKSKYYELRIKAGFELLALKEPDAEQIIDASMRSNNWLERRSAALGLDNFSNAMCRLDRWHIIAPGPIRMTHVMLRKLPHPQDSVSRIYRAFPKMLAPPRQ